MPGRNIGSRQELREIDPTSLEVDLGIDYGAILASWLTAWERHDDQKARQRIVDTLTDVGRMANGYFTGVAHFNIETGHFDLAENHIVVSHLSAVFGIVEVLSEIFDLLELPEFEQTWLEYCRHYLDSPAQQQDRFGTTWSASLRQGHTRLRAWAAARLGDDDLAVAAWREFLHGRGDRWNLNDVDSASVRVIDTPEVLEPVSVITAFTTNDGAQYSLAAIQNLALIGPALARAVGQVEPGTP